MNDLYATWAVPVTSSLGFLSAKTWHHTFFCATLNKMNSESIMPLHQMFLSGLDTLEAGGTIVIGCQLEKVGV